MQTARGHRNENGNAEMRTDLQNTEKGQGPSKTSDFSAEYRKKFDKNW